jgi:hypothetical protein
LDEAIVLSKEKADPGSKPAAAKPEPATPVKMIISANKQLFDQAKDGPRVGLRISFEQFRQRARVETVGKASDPH